MQKATAEEQFWPELVGTNWWVPIWRYALPAGDQWGSFYFIITAEAAQGI